MWNDINGLNTKTVNENSNMITSSPNHPYHHKIHNGHISAYSGHHEPIYVEQDNQVRWTFSFDRRCDWCLFAMITLLLHQENNDTAETSFCDGYQQIDFQKTDDTHNRNYIRNGSPHLAMTNNRNKVESNTFPLLRHNGGIRDPCLDDTDWQVAPPAADSEKFI